MKKNIKVTKVKDKKLKKNMEELLNYTYEDFKDIIQAVTKTRMYLEAVYGIQTDSRIWEDIIQAVVERDTRKGGGMI